MKLPPIPFLLGFNVVLTVTAHSLLRFGSRRVGAAAHEATLSIPRLVWRAATSGPIVAGVATFVVSLALWLTLLSKVKISALYPIQQSLVFIGIQFVAWRWFGEGASLIRLIGVAVICVGVYLVARG